MTSNPCLEYTDVYGRKTDLIHIAKRATYPINILGNAATADVANNPIEDLLPESTDTISFRSGDELDAKVNEFTHKITKVDEAVNATNDSEGNNISETYAKKSEAVELDPETGKIPTEYLPDSANNVNFVNGQTGTVELTAEDIPYNETKTTKEQIDNIVSDTNSAITALNTNKADKTEIPLAGEELYTTAERIGYDQSGTFYDENDVEICVIKNTPNMGTSWISSQSRTWDSGQFNCYLYYSNALMSLVVRPGEQMKFYRFEDVSASASNPINFDYGEQVEISEEEFNNLIRIRKFTYTKTNREITTFNAYKYEADQIGNEFRLIKKNTADSTEEIVNQFSINANAIFAFAPQSQVFDLTTNLHVRINMDNAEVYNMAYLEALDKSTGTWTIHNDGNDRIYVMRFGGRFNSGARISPMPHGEFIDTNNSITFILDSDDPYLDRNSFGLLVWRLGEQA